MEKKMICKCEEEGFSGTKRMYTVARIDDYGKRVFIPNSIKSEKFEEVLDWIDINQGRYTERIFPTQIYDKELSGNHPSIMDFWESLSIGQRFDILKNDFDEVEAFKSAKLHFYELPNKIASYLMNKGSKELSGKIVNEELAKTSTCNKVESVRYFKKGIAGSLSKKQVEDYCFEKE